LILGVDGKIWKDRITGACVVISRFFQDVFVPSLKPVKPADNRTLSDIPRIYREILGENYWMA